MLSYPHFFTQSELFQRSSKKVPIHHVKYILQFTKHKLVTDPEPVGIYSYCWKLGASCFLINYWWLHFTKARIVIKLLG